MSAEVRGVQKIGALSVLFVMATEHEYGPRLRELITPLITGVGPVEAAAAVGATLGALAAESRLPDIVFALGSAGSRKLDHAGIYQAASVSYRDMDASALGFARGVVPFLGEPAEIAIPHRIPGIAAASLSTGGAIISGAGYDAIAADMVDMETYAIVRAAARFGVPAVTLRGISDGRAELTGMHDWTATLREIDVKLAAAVRAFTTDAEAGRFSL